MILEVILRKRYLFRGMENSTLSPKNCSLAYDIDVDFEDKMDNIAQTMEPNLKVISHKRFSESSSVEEIVFVKGRINVSF